MRSRARYCLNGNAGDPGCIGSENEESTCSAPPCQGTTVVFSDNNYVINFSLQMFVVEVFEF